MRSIDDEAALWRSFTAAIRTAVPAGSATVADGLDQPRFRALLASIVATVVAGSDADAATGTRAVTLPAQRLFGHAVALAGTRQVAHEHGLLAIATDAAGTLDDPAATVAVHLVRHLDPARGLLVDSTRTTRTTLGSGPAARTLVSTTSYVVAAPVS